MPELLKDGYNKAFIKNLAENIKHHNKSFNDQNFILNVFSKEWPKYELKERMRHITICLKEYLPSSYKKSIEILIGTSENFQNSFYGMIFPDFVELYGLDDWDISMKALEEFTKTSSSEFAVRQFILKNKNKMMGQMKKWAKSENYHVRRLASEGCRPRLPWACALPAFKKDPTLIFPILNILKNDESEYVRRSVANNLNDISKDHANKVISFCKENSKKNANLDKLIKHALRTLLKAGNPAALKIIGYTSLKNTQIRNLNITPSKVNMGDALKINCDIIFSNTKEKKIRIEYAMHFLKANKTHTEKVFKVSEGHSTDKIKRISKNHSFKKISTRKYYPGEHKVSIIVNGSKLKEMPFILCETNKI